MGFSARIFLGGVAVAVTLSACGGAKDNPYLRNETVRPLEVPPDLIKPAKDKSYDIPQISALLSNKLELSDGDVRLERDGQLRWLAITVDRAVLWRRVHDFWADSGVAVAWESPDLGILETQWIPSAESRYAKDKYRIRIEPGKTAETSELYLSHRRLREEFVGGEWAPVWGDTSSDRELEIEVLGKLLRFLGVSEKKVASTSEDAAKVLNGAELKSARDSAYILVADPLPRVWQRVGVALDHEGFEIIARDRQRNTYRVMRPRPEEEAPGFGVAPHQRQEFLIRLSAQGKKTRVEVATPDGQAQTLVAKDILSRLQSQLL